MAKPDKIPPADHLQEMMPEKNFFGISDWNRLYPEIFLPSDPILPDILELGKILEERDPFDRSLNVKDSHFLFYLPQGLDLKKFEKLCPGTNQASRFRAYTNQGPRCWYNGKKFITDSSLGEWHLAYLNPMPKSIGVEHEEAKKQLPANYELPKILPAAAMHLLYAAKNQEHLNLIYMGRTASVDGNSRITVGRFNHSGLLIGKADDDEDEIDLGTFVCRKIKRS